MQCPSCGLENLPTSVRCYDCGFQFDPDKTYLKLSDEAAKQISGFQAWLRTLPLPSPMIEGDLQSLLERALILPLIWIPGMAQWAMDHYEKGLAFLILTVIPLLLGFTLFNHWISNILIPIGILVYVWALIDGFYTWQERHYPVIPSVMQRIKAIGFILGCFVFMILFWGPDVHLMPVRDSYYEPVITKGDYLFLNPQPGITRTYQRGDLVAVNYSGSTTLSRIIGFPKETIYHQKDKHFYLLGKRLDSGLESMNSDSTNRRIDIPANSYLVALHIQGTNLTRYYGTDIVPAHAVLGRIGAVVSPASHRKILR